MATPLDQSPDNTVVRVSVTHCGQPVEQSFTADSRQNRSEGVTVFNKGEAHNYHNVTRGEDILEANGWATPE